MNRPSLDDLRRAIRELLAEELAALDGGRRAAPPAHEESVRVGSDAELAAFARHVAELSADAAVRADIVAGRRRFRLSGVPAAVTAPAAAATTRFDQPLVTEREVQKLKAGSHVAVAKRTRFTPLARDLLRSRGITIERSDT